MHEFVRAGNQMKPAMLTKKRIPPLIAFFCLIEGLIYSWAAWTSTLDRSNFFAIEQEFIFDKCARNAGRISTVIILITLFLVGYYGLKEIYSDEKKKESFVVLITLFSINHLIHLLFVFLRFKSHGESINLAGPIHLGGTLHGFFTFIFIIIIPFILWSYKHLNEFLYFVIILHLLNISCFIIKTFLGKVKPPDHPAYHNQFGVVVMAVASFYILYRVYLENKPTPKRTI
jgi:hypothetical protein